MPPRLRLASAVSLARRPKSLNGSFYCPSCSLWGFSRSISSPSHLLRSSLTSLHLRQQQQQQQQQQLPAATRHVSTIASSSRVNAPTNIPKAGRELYDALQGLKNLAGSYVNISRLQLALRGLENEDAVVRVAILNIGNQDNAKKLARVLLADPLSPARPWEQQLEDIESNDGKAIILSYGDESDEPPRSPLFRTIFTPSRVLQKYNLELLISTININSNGPGGPASSDGAMDAILVPAIQVPTSATGRVTLVTYPVHKALILGDGLEDLISFGRFTASETDENLHSDCVKLAIATTGSLVLERTDSNAKADKPNAFSMVNVDQAKSAVDKFRESISNSVAYEQGWFQSGIPTLVQWLELGTTASTASGGIKPAIQSLVEAVVTEVETNLMLDDRNRLNELVKSRISDGTRQSILNVIGDWSEFAHTELRDQLDGAFSSRNWRKLVWWKLFWRVDDVGMITSELLQRRWLIDAEKGLIWVAGRIEQVATAIGYRRPKAPAAISTTSTPTTDIEAPLIGSAPPELTLEDLARDEILARRADSSDFPLPEPRAWPTDIPSSRTQLLLERVPSLQALAQRLVIEALSTVGITSGISAFTYFALSSASLYEAGAIAALGLVISMRRMQTRWESARESWESDVRETGRKTLKASEIEVRSMLDQLSQPSQRESELLSGEGAEQRRKAEEAVVKAREALDRLQSNKPK